MMKREHHISLGLHRFGWPVHKPLKVFAPGTSLRKRVAYSLAIVRLILVPVIALAVYYLFAMGWIVDRIVRVDAQATTLADSVSIQMLNARRMELNYFLLNNPADLQASYGSLDALQKTLTDCARLLPAESHPIVRLQSEVRRYRERLADAVNRVSSQRGSSTTRLRNVLSAYETNLNSLVGRSRHEPHEQLLEDLRNQTGSFDTQIALAVAAGDPVLRQATDDLEASSNTILKLSSDLEAESWNRVRSDHREARHLVTQAEWALSIVSALVFILSIIVSYILPRQVVKPLLDLKGAVDHAAAGHYSIEFDVQGKGEVAQLANSVQDLITHVSQKHEESKVNEPS
ncbi:MAG: HAMP domain-containing protein [Terriglobia bacterium]